MIFQEHDNRMRILPWLKSVQRTLRTEGYSSTSIVEACLTAKHLLCLGRLVGFTRNVLLLHLVYKVASQKVMVIPTSHHRIKLDQVRG